MKRTTKRLLAILLCFVVLPIEGLAVQARNKAPEPPTYMRELSRLIAATASEDDFGEMQLVIGEPEMEVDGKTQLIDEDAYAVPYIDENGEAQIPAVIFDDVPDEVGAISPAELEEKGYDVQVNEMAGTITITEPYGLCRLIVKTADGKVRDNFDAVRELHVSNNRTVLQYADKAAAERAANRFAQEKDILFCEPDGFITACAASETTYKNWGTTAAGADQFMATLPDNLPQVTVAVIDTGVDANHPFLAGRIVGGGWDFVNDDNDPDDDHFHGTHCAGVIRDATPDNVKILPVKALDNAGSGMFSMIAESITYAANRGVQIISLSLGGAGGEDVLTDAVKYALSMGKTVTAAAGNDGIDTDEIAVYPACCPGVITVAATDDTDFPELYSNFGSAVDLAAPGSNIISAVPGGGFRALSGTSMACPLVAAFAALLKSQDMTRTSDDLRTILCAYTRDAYTPGRDNHVGSGIVYFGTLSPPEKIYTQISSVTLECPDSTTILPRFIPAHTSDCAAVFESSDPSVVIAEENGRIHAVRGGTATVTITVGGLQTQYTVHVTGGNKLQMSQIMPVLGGKLLLQSDGTAWSYGNSLFHLGTYSASVDSSPFKFQSEAGVQVTQIDRFLTQDGFLKRDGTFWLFGSTSRGLRSRAIPVMAVKENGEPLMGVTAQCNNFLWLDDGTVWYTRQFEDPVYHQLYTEFGAPVANALPPHHGTTVFVTSDGFAYTPTYTKEEHVNATNVTPYYAKQLCYGDGTPVRNARDYSSSLVLLTDGTVVSINTGAIRATDVRQIYGSGRFLGVLREDGTAWNLQTNMPVTKADGNVLSGIVKLNGYSDGNNFALLSDGTVWAWGTNGSAGEQSRDGTRWISTGYGYLGIGWNEAKRVLDTMGLEVLHDLIEDSKDGGYTYRMIPSGMGESKTGVSAPFVTQATQVLIDAETPLTDVKDMDRTMFIRNDNSVYMTGALRYEGYGGFWLHCAVYARPFTIFGQQVYLEDMDVPSAYSTERVQRIMVSRPHMASTVGDTFTLTASVFPQDTCEHSIVWRSSDLSVATVDGTGTVTVHNPGFAVIRAYAMRNEKVWGECVLTVEEDAPVKVEMRQYPTIRTFSTADAFSTAGGLLHVTYQNGQVRSLFISPDFCSGYDLTKTGEQTVTVRFAGSTFSYPITVTEAAAVDPDNPPQDRTVTGIQWEKKPADHIGLAGGSFFAPEASIRVLYADGSSAVVLLTPEMCSGYDMQRIGRQAVTVKHEGFTLLYSMFIKPRLSWEVYPKVNIGLLGGNFVAPEASVRVQNEDGTSEILPLTAAMCSGYDMHSTGYQTVTVTYGGHTISYYLTLLPRLSWAHYPENAIGVIGGSFVVPEATVRIQNEDGSVELLPLMAEMCSGYDMAIPGEQTVTVTAGGASILYTTTFIPRLCWTNKPQTVSIAYGAPLTVPDETFSVYADDGSFETVTPTAEMCVGFDPYTYGIQTVTLQYDGSMLPFSVVVGLENITSLEVETLPAKRCYAVFHDTWPDVTGGTLRVTYADGTKQIIPMSEAAIRYTPKWAGTHTETQLVYLDYGACTASYTIYNVKSYAAPIETAVITRLPDKTVYTVGERYDLTGGRIYVRMTDGAEGEEDMSRFTGLSGLPATQFTEAREYTAWFTLRNREKYFNLSFTITVVEATNYDPVEPDVPGDPTNPEAPDSSAEIGNPDAPDSDVDPMVDPSGERLEEPPFQLFWLDRPTKTVYCIGETLDPSGGQFEADHNGNIQTLTSEMCSGFDPMQSGRQTVTVTYAAHRYGEAMNMPLRTGTLTFDVFVTELMLDNEVPEIETGKCTRILATFQPRDVDGREIIWSSSDETIATVDEYGRVTGIAPGEVTITAQVKDSDAVASCTVTVVPRTAERLPGDADGDGEVTLKDCVQITRYLAGGWDAVIDLMNADVNGDGVVNLKDVVLIRRYLAGGWGVELK